MRIAAAAIAVVLGSLSPTVALSQDANQEVAAGTNSMAAARKMLRQLGLTKLEAASLEAAQARGDLCAFAQIQGPAGNFNIQPVISNFVTNEVDVVILDVFGAAGGASLLIDSVFSVTPPPGGSLDVEYPSGVPGEGPAVLSSTGWGFGESAFFNLDPDAYDDPAFGATVADMTGTRIEVVYTGDRRCAGTLVFNAGLNASIAFITQTFP
jgi:hypothetical protein